jgi:signal peptidase I
MNLKKIIWDFFETLIIAAFLYFIIVNFLFQPHKVQGLSMFPTFHDGDFLLTSKLSYLMNEPKFGDVVVFKSPNERYEYIKRIIGMPGDRIKLINGDVYVNGYLIDESQYLDDIETHGESFLQDGLEVVVPPSSYFMMGDNRPGSSDSRDFGSIPYEDMVGKVFFRYWPVTSLGRIQDIEAS